MSASGVLKVLEATAFSSLVGAFRAQGDLTPEKKEILTNIAELFKISHERYKAEIRRAISDDTLAEIAEKVAGPGTESSWVPEGRRNVKLLKRKPAKLSGTLQEYLAKLAETEAVLPPAPVLRQPPACPPTLPADFSVILLADQVTSSMEESAPPVEETKGKKGGRSDRSKTEEDEEPPSKKAAVEKPSGKQNMVIDLEDSASPEIVSESLQDWESPPPLVPISSVQRGARQPPPLDTLSKPAKYPPRPIRQVEAPASRNEIRLPPPPKQPPVSRIFPIPAPPELPLDQQIRASFKPERGTLTPIRSQVKYVTLPPSQPRPPRPTLTPSVPPRGISLAPKPAVKHISLQPRAPKAPLPRLLTQQRAPSPRLLNVEPAGSKPAPKQQPLSKDQLLSQGSHIDKQPSAASKEAVQPDVAVVNAPEPNWSEILAGGEQEEALSLDEAVTLLENTPDAKNLLQYIANSLEQGQAKDFPTDQISFEDFSQ